MSFLNDIPKIRGNPYLTYVNPLSKFDLICISTYDIIVILVLEKRHQSYFNHQPKMSKKTISNKLFRDNYF